jgi:hypothetical protein
VLLAGEESFSFSRSNMDMLATPAPKAGLFWWQVALIAAALMLALLVLGSPGALRPGMVAILMAIVLLALTVSLP